MEAKKMKKVGYGKPISSNMTAELCPFIEENKNDCSCNPPYEALDRCSFEPRNNFTAYGDVAAFWRTCTNSSSFFNGTKHNYLDMPETDCPKKELCYCDYRDIDSYQKERTSFLNCICKAVPLSTHGCRCDQMARVECFFVNSRGKTKPPLLCKRFFSDESLIEMAIECNDALTNGYYVAHLDVLESSGDSTAPTDLELSDEEKQLTVKPSTDDLSTPLTDALSTPITVTLSTPLAVNSTPLTVTSTPLAVTSTPPTVTSTPPTVTTTKNVKSDDYSGLNTFVDFLQNIDDKYLAIPYAICGLIILLVVMGFICNNRRKKSKSNYEKV